MNPAGFQTLSVLIPDGDTWDTVKVLRCLGPSAISYVISGQATPLSKFSRFCRGHYIQKNDEERLGNIRAMILKLRIDVVFPVLENAIELVIQHQSALSDIVAIPHLPSINSFRIVRDKSLFHSFCLQNNLPVPSSILLNGNLESTYDKIDTTQLPSPLLLKPITASGGGRGITIIRSNAEQSEALKRAYQTGKQYILQSYIPGDDLCLCGYCRGGVIQKYTIQKSLFSHDNYFGPQRAMDFIDDVRVVEVCSRLTAALEWEGLICIDLRIDSRDQSIKFLEVNPRVGQAVLGSFSTGINFPILACLDAKGMQPPDMLYTPSRYYHPRESWRMLLPSNKSTRCTGRSHSGLRYTLNDPLPDLVDLARRLRSYRRKSRQTAN